MAKHLPEELNFQFERETVDITDWQNPGVYTIRGLTAANIAATPSILNRLQPIVIPQDIQKTAQLGIQHPSLEYFRIPGQPEPYIIAPDEDAFKPPESTLTIPFSHISGAQNPDFKSTALLYSISHNTLRKTVDVDDDGSIWMTKENMVKMNEEFVSEATPFLNTMDKMRAENFDGLNSKELAIYFIEALREVGIPISQSELSSISLGTFVSKVVWLERLDHLIGTNDNLAARANRYPKDRYKFEGLHAMDESFPTFPLNTYHEEPTDDDITKELPKQNEKKPFISVVKAPSFDPSKKYNNEVRITEEKPPQIKGEKTPKEPKPQHEVAPSRDMVRKTILAIAACTSNSDDEYLTGISTSIFTAYGNPSLDHIADISLEDVNEQTVLELIDTGYISDLELTLLTEILSRRTEGN